MNRAPVDRVFNYDEAFSRNIGWVTEWEQGALKGKRVAIAGMGGVGGAHLLTLARLGIGAFTIADLDTFELANMNRQTGAMMNTLGRPKVEVLAEMARAINPELDLRLFSQGIHDGDIDAFLEGADLFVDGFDFFVLDIRAKVFARCAQLGIPAVTAAPLGFGTAYLVFMPGGTTFEEYFRLGRLPPERQYVNFFLGLAPTGLQRGYLMDPTRLDLNGRKGPSSSAACQLCAGVVGAEAVKILLRRGRVRAAPWYHQFDAYEGRLVTRRLLGGNRNPIQAMKLHAAYRGFARLANETRAVRSSVAEHSRDIERILDLARWAPSGDNTQPWRFEIKDDNHLTVHVRDQADDDVYDYNDGQPTLLSAGMLLETMRISASRFGRMMWWAQRESSNHRHVIDVALPSAAGIAIDPLSPFVTTRSVDRRPYRLTRLTADQKAALADALGEEFEIRWYEERAERSQMARLNGQATDIRLRIPEAFRVHKRILDWDRRFSPTGIPKDATGLDPVTLTIMHWAMRDWARMERLNRAPGGTLAARVQMDYLPGYFCAAHFSIVRKKASSKDERVQALLKAGQALQRFWLTATQLGLAMQPGMAAAIFGFYGREGIAFTGDPAMRSAAERLAAKLDKATGVNPDSLVFLGRIGEPRTRQAKPRSVRLPLHELLVPQTEAVHSIPAEETRAVR